MLKKLLIPCLFVAAAIAINSGGCGSSSGGGAAGKGGAGKGAAGSTGTAGTTTGSAGSTAGATGSAGATAGATGSGGSTTDGGGADAALPACTSTSSSDPAFSAADFCKVYLATCGTTRTGYMTEAECLASYGAVTTQKGCRTYHLCNAVRTHDTATHCPHAVGIGQCAM